MILNGAGVVAAGPDGNDEDTNVGDIVDVGEGVAAVTDVVESWVSISRDAAISRKLISLRLFCLLCPSDKKN